MVYHKKENFEVFRQLWQQSLFLQKQSTLVLLIDMFSLQKYLLLFQIVKIIFVILLLILLKFNLNLVFEENLKCN